MLCKIRVQNFAIIDRLEVHFSPGFNVITGETGAGKSIIIDAVDLLLGGRGDLDFVRAGAEKATIEGVFKIPAALQTEVKTMLDGEGIEANDRPDEILMTGELRSNGRNVCRINGTTASLQFFRTLGERLVDIHGQSEHLSLRRSPQPISLLARYANLDDQRTAVTGLLPKLTQTRGESDNLVHDD